MIFRHGLIFRQAFCLCHGDVGVLHGERAADTAAATGVQLYECEPVEFLVFEFLQHS